MTRILLVRHGNTDALGKHLSGRMPGVHLNEAGRQQADNLVKRLLEAEISCIYSSPLERAVETATPLAIAKNVQVITIQNFIELDFGEWTGRSFNDLDKNILFQRFNTLRSNTIIPGGESMHEAQARMISGIQKLCKLHPNETIVIISHSDMIKATIAWYSGIPLDLFQRLEISPASISTIEIYEDAIRIVGVNNVDP